jgi:hypothetical protein
MATCPAKLEHMLQGSSNFSSSKTRVMKNFVEFDLDDLVTRDIEEPTFGAGKSTFQKKQAKSKRIIYDSINDSMMPLLHTLATMKECMDAPSKLYDTKTPFQKRSLKKQIHSIKMDKIETIASFFCRVSQLKEQLLVVGAQT